MSPKGVNHYELVSLLYADSLNKEARFPSPTGVKYYELESQTSGKNVKKPCFRPQQGLSIMNRSSHLMTATASRCFRPQQGLSIMNYCEDHDIENIIDGFRPQQGLSIMNGGTRK